jgi:hypothetical protein
MPTKADIISSIAKELRIIAHLTSKLQPAQLAFRFTPGQRSTQELLEYLAVTAEGVISAQLTGSWAVWEKREEEVKGLDLARFPAAFAAQQQAVESLLAPFSESQFAAKRVVNFQGKDVALAEALFEGIVKQLVGYKTQLFLQAKAAGLSGLGSANLWRGEDAAAKAV